MDDFLSTLNKSRNKGMWLQAKMYAKFFSDAGRNEEAERFISVIREKNDPAFNVNESILENTLYYKDNKKDKQEYE